jgi:hypothetical protein
MKLAALIAGLHIWKRESTSQQEKGIYGRKMRELPN